MGQATLKAIEDEEAKKEVAMNEERAEVGATLRLRRLLLLGRDVGIEWIGVQVDAGERQGDSEGFVFFAGSWHVQRIWESRRDCQLVGEGFSWGQWART